MHLLELEKLHHLLARQHLAVVARIPPEKKKVVEKRLRQISLGTELSHKRGTVAL